VLRVVKRADAMLKSKVKVADMKKIVETVQEEKENKQPLKATTDK
jgi:flagellar biosynthesis component FlhA